MTTTWLIRHGQSRGNAGSRTTGSAANPLTPLGEQQARSIADAFDRAPDLVVCSPYLRAQQTAQPTIDRFPSVRVEEWPIEECRYLGRFHGKPTTGADRAAAVAEYWETADPHYRDDENSESFVDIHTRAHKFLARLEETGCQQVAAFTHGMFTRVVLWAILTGGDSVPDSDNMRRFYKFRVACSIPNGSILPIRLHGTYGYQFLPAATAHLPAALQSGGR